MKKTLCFLATCFLLALAWAPGVVAEGNSNAVVVLGDGAPIPYLDGFQSMLFQGADAIEGVTGALPDIESVMKTDDGTWRFQLQNLVLTDDVLGLFFTQTYSEPIQYEGKSAFAYSFAALAPDVLIDGKSIDLLNQFTEGHPIDACSQYSFVIYTLSEPVRDGQTLTFGATWNEAKQAWAGGTAVTVDRSRAKDPTVACEPSLNVKKSLALWKGDDSINYDFTVKRVARTPFGNRILLCFTGTCERNQYLDYQLLDGDGNALNIVPQTLCFQSNASREHPVQNDNEAWFFGGENSAALTLVPLGGDPAKEVDADRTASVPLATLPVDVKLENGVTMRVESCDVTDDGFYARYTTDGYAGYVSFDLADADGNPLGLCFDSYLLDDHSRGLLGYGGCWSEEYKGKTVPRVTEEQLLQVKTLLIKYTVGCPVLLENEAIRIDLPRW